jgi:crossover junction endodeoxyribonuclease RuvC
VPRVLGVDPGLTRCGVGVVEGDLGRPLRLVAVEVVRTPSGDDPALRLRAMHAHLDRLVGQHRPDTVAVERVFADVNVMTVMGTAQAAAVAMLVAAEHGIPVRLHTPTEVKAAVTGNGRAGKAQVTAMVTRLLALGDPPRPADAADALALAICQAWRGEAAARLADAARRHGAARPPGRSHKAATG